MAETQTYQESENFVPDPTAQFGTLDTSGTAGAAHAKMEEISPVFEIARTQVAQQAARALDPEDPTPASLVVLPDSDRTREDAEEKVKAAAKRTEGKEPAEIVREFRTTPAQETAAEDGDEAAAKADAEQRNVPGLAGGGLDGSGSGTTLAEGDKSSDEGDKTEAKKASGATKKAAGK